MMTWPDTRLTDLFGIELPIVQAPMANASAVDMAVAVANAGGLGSFPCASLTDDKVAEGVASIRARTNRPINLNFFCHTPAPADEARDAAWLKRLAPYYAELGAEIPALPLKASIVPFTAATCAVVEKLAPAVVSFHFGLPEPALLARVKAAGCKVISSATSLREARVLAEAGVDAVIAQGAEAGGHRGMFLETNVATQIGTLALVHEIVNAVRVPVIAAGGIVDGRGIAGATQTNLNYLPEHNTDFIFSSLAEQRGFLGAAILLLLYALIAWRGVKIVAIAPSLFTSALAGAIVFSFLFQIFINIGMTIGIAPVTGIPLPFVSFGGSSLITTLLMIGLLESIHVRGKLAGRK